MLPTDKIDSVLQNYIDCALFFILNEGRPCPDRATLELICRLGAEAEVMWFCAALVKPTRTERRGFFNEFVRRSLNSEQMNDTEAGHKGM
jgi:hypothetical protein